MTECGIQPARDQRNGSALGGSTELTNGFDLGPVREIEGATPTVMAVRKRLGGGSPNNIAKWLGEWKAQNETTRVEALPPLPEPVEAATRQVWGSPSGRPAAGAAW